MVHDDELVGLDGVQVKFDDERVVCGAGIVVVATLAARLGIEALAGHQLGRHAHDPLAARQQEPLQRPGDMSAVLDRPDPLTLVQSAHHSNTSSNDRRLARTVRSAITRPVAASTAPTVCDALCVSAPITIISTIPSLGLRTDARWTHLSRGDATLLSSHAGNPRTAAGDTTTDSQTTADNQG